MVKISGICKVKLEMFLENPLQYDNESDSKNDNFDHDSYPLV